VPASSIIVGIALLLLTLALRSVSVNRLVRSRLLTSCVLFGVYAFAAALAAYGRLPADVAQEIRGFNPLLLVFGLATLVVVLAINPWREDRLPDRFPTIVPSKLEVPGLSGTINMNSARGFLDWYQATMAKEVGSQADKAEKEATLEFLSPDYSKAICRIRFHRVGLTGISVLQSQANAESTKALKFDLSVEDVSVDDMSGMDDGSVTGTAGVIS